VVTIIDEARLQYQQYKIAPSPIGGEVEMGMDDYLDRCGIVMISKKLSFSQEPCYSGDAGKNKNT
jgi:hypothetical protein